MASRGGGWWAVGCEEGVWQARAGQRVHFLHVVEHFQISDVTSRCPGELSMSYQQNVGELWKCPPKFEHRPPRVTWSDSDRLCLPAAGHWHSLLKKEKGPEGGE